MPQNATQIAGADRIVPAADLAATLVDLVRSPLTPAREGPAVDPMDQMPEVVREDMGEQIRNERVGQVSLFTCPECGGSLWQVAQTRLTQFRCHVGHAYNGEALLAEQSEALEAALWTAVRTFKEKVMLSRQLAAQERGRGQEATAGRFDEQADQAQEYASLILKHVLNGDGPDRTPAPRVENSQP